VVPTTEVASVAVMEEVPITSTVVSIMDLLTRLSVSFVEKGHTVQKCFKRFDRSFTGEDKNAAVAVTSVV
jgi:hypothetical protein